MWQRIQTIYLLLASGAIFSLFALPFATASNLTDTDKAQTVIFGNDLAYNLDDHMALLILTIMFGVLAFVNILLFRNRKLQTRICSLITSLGMGLLIFGMINLYLDVNDINADIMPWVGAGMPVLALVFNSLAKRGIKADEKLVRSSDRLR